MTTTLTATRTMPTVVRSGLVPDDERAQCLHGDVSRQREERTGDHPQGHLLAALGVGRGELPGHRGGRADLDDRVEPEPDQRDRARHRPGADGDDRFDHVVGDGGGHQQPDPATENGAAGEERRPRRGVTAIHRHAAMLAPGGDGRTTPKTPTPTS
jgi:hypothetical protein